uniref:Uncharacterized protein n=1 Tax=Anguilla anguilla TaxID=7936 RepID=A0A0E9UZB0_ANGAN
MWSLVFVNLKGNVCSLQRKDE